MTLPLTSLLGLCGWAHLLGFDLACDQNLHLRGRSGGRTGYMAGWRHKKEELDFCSPWLWFCWYDQWKEGCVCLRPGLPVAGGQIPWRSTSYLCWCVSPKVFFHMIFTTSLWASSLWLFPGFTHGETLVIFDCSLHLLSLLERWYWEPPLEHPDWKVINLKTKQNKKPSQKALDLYCVRPQRQMPLLASPLLPPVETLAQDRVFALSP